MELSPEFLLPREVSIHFLASLWKVSGKETPWTPANASACCFTETKHWGIRTFLKALSGHFHSHRAALLQ